MLCSISGEALQDPVASSKSGNVYEKRLITAFISENHKDPITGEDLEIDDLIDLKASRVVVPRPPTITSIPSLLSTFQNEWDALALETFTLRKHLQETRQELATALYQHDAAVRVIARLTKERDQAREALSKVRINTQDVKNEDSMQIDLHGLPDELSIKVDTTQERRKRPLPVEWADNDVISKFETTSESEPLYSKTNFLAVNETGDHAIVGGTEGVVGIYSISENKIQKCYKVEGSITDAIWFGARPVISTSLGVVRLLEVDEVSFSVHSGGVNSLALHPCGEILASVGDDKSFVFYDLIGEKSVSQVFTDSELITAAFHPDGHLFAAGGNDGQVKLFHVKTCENAAIFNLQGPIHDLTFSENGIWFSAVVKNSETVVIFDLRKEGKSAEAKVFQMEESVNCIRWDYSGQYLAVSGYESVKIYKYTKSSKSWSDVVTLNVSATALAWGPEARSLITINSDGVVKVLKANL